MKELEMAVETAKAVALEKPWVFAVAAVTVLFIAFFWWSIFLVLRGLAYAAIALVAILAGILLWAKVHYEKPNLKELLAEKRRLIGALEIAEKKYMKRKLSEEDFNKIFKEKQRKLIEVEAMVNREAGGEKNSEAEKELLAVQTKKRHILKGLLDEKKMLLNEMDIAEKKYLKRKIDAATYQELVQKSQKKLIELEAEIKRLYSEANISKVMEKLKKNLSEIEEGKKKKTRKKKEDKQKIAQEIAEQVLLD